MSSSRHPEYQTVASNDESSVREKLKIIVIKYLQGESIKKTKLALEEICFPTDSRYPSDMNPDEPITATPEIDLQPKHCKKLFESVLIPNANDIVTDFHTNAILGSLNIKKPAKKEDDVGHLLDMAQSSPDHPDETTPSKNNLSDFTKLLDDSRNLYELLIHLADDGHHQLDPLIEAINGIKPRHNILPFYILSVFGILFGATYWEAIANFFVEKAPLFRQWLYKTFSSPKNIPIIGIVFSSISLMVAWYKGIKTGSTPSSHKLSRLAPKTLADGLTIAAYVISYRAGGNFPIIAGCLFVASSAIDIIKGFYVLMDSSKTLRAFTPKKNKTNDNTQDEDNPKTWAEKAAYARAKNFHERALKSVKWEIATAIISTAVIYIWSFGTQDLPLNIVCIALLLVTAITKQYIINSINADYASKLQIIISNISDNTPLNPELKVKEELASRAGSSYSSIVDRTGHGIPDDNQAHESRPALGAKGPFSTLVLSPQDPTKGPQVTPRV